MRWLAEDQDIRQLFLSGKGVHDPFRHSKGWEACSHLDLNSDSRNFCGLFLVLKYTESIHDFINTPFQLFLQTFFFYQLTLFWFDFYHSHCLKCDFSNFKNVGISDPCLCACSVVSDSLWPQGLQPSRLCCPRNFPGKNTGVGCHALLHQYLLCLLCWQADSLPLSHLGSPTYFWCIQSIL